MPVTKWLGREFYIGGLYVGEVCRLVPDNWRLSKIYLQPDGRLAHIIANFESVVVFYEQMEATPWRARFMSDSYGSEVGFYATEHEAKAALAGHLADALGLVN